MPTQGEGPSCSECEYGFVGASLHSCGMCDECCRCYICSVCEAGRSITVSGPPCEICYGCTVCCTCYICPYCLIRCTTTDGICRSCGGGIGNQLARCNCCSSERTVTRRQLTYSLTRFVDPGGEHSLMGSPRLLAAELEIASITLVTCRSMSNLNTILDDWSCSVVNDASLSAGGFEINTCPASGAQFISQISTICSALHDQGAKVDNHCGCHIHADARDCGYYEISKVLRLYAGLEPALFALVPAYRRTNRYCCPCGAAYLKAIIRCIDDRADKGPLPPNLLRQRGRGEVKPDRNVTRSTILEALYGHKRIDTRKVRSTKSNDNRYRALNLHSWMHRGSLELRLPPGLLDAQDIIGWGTILASIVDHALTTPVKVIMDSVAFIIPLLRTRTTNDALALTYYNPLWKLVTPESLELLKSLSPNEDHKKWVAHKARLYRGT